MQIGDLLTPRHESETCRTGKRVIIRRRITGINKSQIRAVLHPRPYQIFSRTIVVINMEINNRISYMQYLIRIFILLFVALLFSSILRPNYLVIYLIISTIISIVILSMKFTQKVVINSIDTEIYYFIFLNQRKIKLSTSRIKFKIKSEVTFRNGKFYLFEVFDVNRKIYTIDSRHGFDEEDFMSIINFKDKITS